MHARSTPPPTRHPMSLRDALLKAGKVSKKQAQEAQTAKRKKRKKKKGHVLEAEARDASLARDAERRADQAKENREREEQRRAEREQHERRMRVGNLITAWQRRPNPRASRGFHFVRSDGHIGRITVDGRIAAELEYGAAGIVELPDQPDELRIVAAEGIRKLLDLHLPGIRFYVGRDAPDDPLICPPRRPERD